MSNDFEKYNKKTLAGVAKDAEAFAIRDLLAETNRNILCILSDGISLNQVYETLSFLQPEADILTLPAWDTVPYDRVSPNAAILSKRIETLAKLVLDAGAKKQRIVLTSIGAAIQKLPPKKIFLNTRKNIQVGGKLNFDEFCTMQQSTAIPALSRLWNRANMPYGEISSTFFPAEPNSRCVLICLMTKSNG